MFLLSLLLSCRGQTVETATSDAALDVADVGDVADEAKAVHPDTEPSCSPPTGAVCDTFPQCGCAAGQKCAMYLSDDYTHFVAACMPIGPKNKGETCARPEECARGTTCNVGLCRQFCASDFDCDLGERCEGVVDVSGALRPDLSVCKATCDPRDPASVCPIGQNCLALKLEGAKTSTECIPAGKADLRGSCAFDTYACAPRLRCDFTGTCTLWCRLDVPTDCATDEICARSSYSVIIAGHDYGTCAKKCDPLSPSTSCASATLTCGVYDDGFGLTYTDCKRAGFGATGASCKSDPNDCAPGFACDFHGTQTCKKMCRVGVSGDCPAGKPCDPLFTGATVAGVTYGSCAP